MKKACLPWVTIGETYQVVLVQSLPFGNDPVSNLIAYEGQPEVPRTCGDAFDLNGGDSISMKALERQLDEHDDHCGCYNVSAEAVVPGVSTLRRETTLLAAPHQGFIGQAQVRLRGNCTGRYGISIAPVLQFFLDHSGTYVATDYVLYRSFVPDDAAKCRVEGSQIDDKGAPDGCWDAWAVKILDASGKSITRSFAMHGDAGTNTSDDDAGRTPADDGGNAP